jgi:uncharacterized protein YprB with RNaseH-like and TPR domain
LGGKRQVWLSISLWAKVKNAKRQTNNMKSIFKTKVFYISKYNFKDIKEQISIGDELYLLKGDNREEEKWFYYYKKTKIGQLHKHDIKIINELIRVHNDIICIVKKKTIYLYENIDVVFYSRFKFEQKKNENTNNSSHGLLVKQKKSNQNIIIEKPTEVTNSYWLDAIRNRDISIPQTEQTDSAYKSGKWLIFIDKLFINDIWDKIKKATETGKLGLASKVSTALENSHSTNVNEYVICVYTKNWQNIEDIERIEKEIRNIGISSTLFYKTDEDSIKNLYKIHGNTGISKYISRYNHHTKKGDISFNVLPHNDLRNLFNIGNQLCEKLKNISILSIEDLLVYESSKTPPKCGITKEYIEKLKNYAISYVENKTIQFYPFAHNHDDRIYIDIETDIEPVSFDFKKVWLISILNGFEYRYFFAKNWDKEYNILSEFLKYLKKHKNKTLVSYSGTNFDFSILSKALKRNKLDYNFFNSFNHIDICSEIKNKFIFPIQKYGLKDIGAYFGYDFKEPDLNGRYVSSTYQHCITNNKEIPAKIFSYVEDDVKSIKFIIDYLNSINLRKI